MKNNTSRQFLLGVACTVLLSGCASIVRPQFGPDKSKQAAYDQAPNFPNALALGASQRDVYLDNVADYAGTERGTGLALIGTTAVAADLAMRSVGSSTVMALGLAGAAGYMANNWLLAKPQQRVFAAGANATQCALDAMQPLYEPYENRGKLTDALDEVQTNARALEATKPDGTGVLETQARRLLARAEAIQQPGKDAMAVLNGAAGTLRASLASIQTQVTNAYIENSPQLQGLLDSLGASLPLAGSKITGVALPEVGAPATNKAASSRGGSHDDDVRSKSNALEKSIQKVSHMIDAINARPSEAHLKLCQVDAKQLGVTLRLSGGDITVQGGGTASTTVTGGVLPYRSPPDWIGTHPPAGQLTSTIETGSGLITVEAKAGATAGVYQLQVRDAGNGVVLMKVTVAATGTSETTGAGANARAGQGKPLTTKAEPDPLVKQVQTALNAQKITVPDATGKEVPLDEDGLSGPNTDKAMKKFLTSPPQNAKPEEIPPDRTKLTRTVADALGIDIPEGWSAK